jgi:secretion/DNA translocation related TadE-like protein
VVATALLGVLLLLGLALGEVAAWVHAHREAQSAADLAALAAATRVDTDPCGAAAVVAESNGAEVLSCQQQGREVTVTVGVDAPHHLGPPAVLDATARAGPS